MALPIPSTLELNTTLSCSTVCQVCLGKHTVLIRFEDNAVIQLSYRAELKIGNKKMQWSHSNSEQGNIFHKLLGKRLKEYRISERQSLVLEFENEIYLDCHRDLNDDFESIMITGSDNSWIVF